MNIAVASPHAPQPIGPYSQATCTETLVFCSGQIGIDPTTGNLVSESTSEQAIRALKNISSVLQTAGSSCRDIVRTDIYLVHMHDFEQVNNVYMAFMQAPYPARITVGVSELPRGARVEIACIATRTTNTV